MIDKLEHFVKQAVENVVLREESIDLNEFIDIVVIEKMSHDVAEYVDGCIFLKNLVEKRMPTELNKAKVLIVQDCFALNEDGYCDLTEVIADQTDFM